MEFKGTKGNWTLSSHENINGRMLFVVQNDGFDSKPNDLMIHITSFSEIETQKANALLISKAPEMLALLKSFAERVDNGGVPTAEFYDSCVELIKSATEL